MQKLKGITKGREEQRKMDNRTISEEELKREKVRVIPLEYVDNFPDHPFKVKDDDEMKQLKISIASNGVLTPIIVRQKADQRYEIISGHRRVFAAKSLGQPLIRAILRDMSREEAIIAMVDANLQREHILPSEKAMAYKMKMEAMKRQGMRTDLTSSPMETKLRTDEIIAQEAGESRNQIQRYIRLTELIPELLQLVDENRIAFRPAVELSYLTEDEQRDLLDTIDSEEATPSLSQAMRMKKLSQEGTLDMDTIFEIMTEQKANQTEKIKLSMDRFEKYFPRGTSPKRIEETIIAALEYYSRAKARKNQERTER